MSPVATSQPFEPAEKADLTDVGWLRLPGGLDWGTKLTRTAPEIAFDSYRPGEAVRVSVYLRNRTDTPRDFPADLYRAAADGAVALRRGVAIHLVKAPFDARTPDRNYPRSEDFKEVAAKRSDLFEAGKSVARLDPDQSIKAFDLDLRDWFALDDKAHYEFHFSIDAGQLGLPDGAPEGAVQVNFGFDVGNRPPKLSFAELNKAIEPLGGKGEEARIASLIRDALPEEDGAASGPKTVPAAVPAEPNPASPFSPSINGVAARLDYVSNRNGEVTVLIVLRNTSDRPMVVPLAVVGKEQPPPFQMRFQAADGSWGEPITPDPASTPTDDGGSFSLGHRSDPPKPRKAEPTELLLDAGKSAAAVLSSRMQRGASESSNVKVIVHGVRANPGPQDWRGTVETQARTLVPPETAATHGIAAPLPFPDHFPAWSAFGFMGGNMSGNESEVRQLSMSNDAADRALLLYESKAVRQEFERRMAAETYSPLKIYLAAIAARTGSRSAALQLLAAMSETDYDTAKNVQSAIGLLLEHQGAHAPDWIVDMALAALADQRYATGMDKTSFGADTVMTLSHIADEDADLVLMLARCGSRRALPQLRRMASGENPTRNAITALQELGDADAIPALLHQLREHESEVELGIAGLEPEIFGRSVAALGKLKSREALPILMRHLCEKTVIEAVEAIGDRSAVPALRKIVADGKPMQVAGSGPETDRDAVCFARIALATLSDDPTAAYCDLLADRSMEKFARVTVVWRINKLSDPSVIPHLIRAIKSDPDGAVAGWAIKGVSTYKTSAAIEGLIECFDVDFSKKSSWKPGFEAADYLKDIAGSLKKLTGQSIGADKQRWLTWWREGGSKMDWHAPASAPKAQGRD